MFLRRIYGDPPTNGIPENWRIELLDNLAKRGSGHTPDKQKPEYWNGGIKWVSLADSNKLDRIYIYETDKEISEEGIANSSAVMHPAGSVVVSRDAGVGKSAILGHAMAVSQHFICWRCGPNLENLFLYYMLQLMKPEFERMAVGSTIKTIGLRFFETLQIPLPPLAEQRKIAQILSTWDEAIALVEALIAALKSRKQGIVQRLLTGEVRFPGFEGEWTRKKAGEIFQPFSKRKNGEEELLSVTQERGVIPRSMLETRVVMPEGTTEGYKLVEPGDFIISLRSFQGGIEHSEYRGLVSPAYTVLKPRLPIERDFYKHLFKSQEFIGRLAVAIIGIRDGKQISFDDFASLRLPYLSLEEQRSVADVLESVDAVISEYSTLGDSLREQKRGLMQRLLTGEVRVQID